MKEYTELVAEYLKAIKAKNMVKAEKLYKKLLKLVNEDKRL